MDELIGDGTGWLVLTVTMGEEDPIHLSAAGIHNEIYVLGIDDGRAKLLSGLGDVTWLRVGDIDSRLRVSVFGYEVEAWIKSVSGRRAKVVIRGPEVRMLRHKLWLDNKVIH